MIRTGIGCCGWIIAIVLLVVLWRMAVVDGTAPAMPSGVDTAGATTAVTNVIDRLSAWLADIVIRLIDGWQATAAK